MADRRMIHRAVICSDEFIDMSHEAQALFFQLQIEADAYGLLASVKKIMRTIGVKDTSLQELVDAGFVISFGNGVIALSHWNVANTRKNDRTEKAHFPMELAKLYEDENKVYHLAEDNGIQLEYNGIQRNPLPAQNSVAQNRVAQNSLGENSLSRPAPTLEEVHQFMTEHARGVNVGRSAERFWNHYQAKRWKCVHDWQPLARNWIEEDAQKALTATQINPALAYDQRNDTDYSGHIVDLSAYAESDSRGSD